MLLIVGLFLIGIFNGFINVTSGGAGLINTPLLLALGLHPYTALATTKFITVGSGVAGSARYHHANILNKKLFIAAILALSVVGGIVGASITFLIDALALTWAIIIVAVIVLVLTLFNPHTTEHTTVSHTKLQYTIGLTGIFLVSIYGGSIGMGAGIAVIALFVHYMRFSYVQSSAFMTIFTLGVTVSSAVTFMLKGAVNYHYGLPLFLGSVVGGWLGAHTAVKKGNGFIKMLTIILSVSLICKVLFDLLL